MLSYSIVNLGWYFGAFVIGHVLKINESICLVVAINFFMSKILFHCILNSLFLQGPKLQEVFNFE